MRRAGRQSGWGWVGLPIPSSSKSSSNSCHHCHHLCHHRCHHLCHRHQGQRRPRHRSVAIIVIIFVIMVIIRRVVLGLESAVSFGSPWTMVKLPQCLTKCDMEHMTIVTSCRGNWCYTSKYVSPGVTPQLNQCDILLFPVHHSCPEHQ